MKKELGIEFNGVVGFIDQMSHDMMRGSRPNKKEFLYDLKTYNRKNHLKLNETEVLYQALINEVYTVASQIYPFVMGDLLEKVKETKSGGEKAAIIKDINNLQDLYISLKEKFCSVN